ncbi:hypothetical protein CHLNCDRAFT_136324 [Chlorella variabilis]|uniref:Methyltransferase type 11 domain-containing protein n=1 Tax=Chlorella variabilis TaxID=554065 RepID=E1ZK43_CHLVA|nr:hypothetical protein CHLNCDRAFT_136324 [Chlorella variabilis]EFN53631.1 hypothetical protein CHLNCDRAFT_136324 [Chlorella variabilis]|eukprot:XP_005845733.1 hypothetical protein CHLNCDRAFT_136324 [Chlorella variabilis]
MRSASDPPGRRTRLLLLLVPLSLLVYHLARRAGGQPALTSSAANGGGGGSCQGATAAAAPGIDFAYDPVAHDARQKEKHASAAVAPLRRPGFKPAANSNQALYDRMWTASNHSYAQNSCWGCRFVADVVAKVEFDSVLDAGTGNSQVVRAMRRRGKAAWGIELSQAVLERDAGDLLEAGLVEQCSLTNLPYQGKKKSPAARLGRILRSGMLGDGRAQTQCTPLDGGGGDKQFDLVFSGDVLEHILPGQADEVAAELVRVARRHIVMSISLKSHENEALHPTLRPRTWWEALFARHGAAPNRALVWALQGKETGFKREEGELSDCRQEGDAGDGGAYEVCVVMQPWLVGTPGQELRERGRCMTPATGELEPWMFAFTVS